MSKPIPLYFYKLSFSTCQSTGVYLEWDVGDGDIKHLESLEEEDDLEQQTSIEGSVFPAKYAEAKSSEK